MGYFNIQDVMSWVMQIIHFYPKQGVANNHSYLIISYSLSFSYFTICPSALAWDVFRSVSRKGQSLYESTTNWFEVAAKTVKVIFYVILFLFVLSMAVSSKASLLLMTQAIGNADLVSRHLASS